MASDDEAMQGSAKVHIPQLRHSPGDDLLCVLTHAREADAQRVLGVDCVKTDESNVSFVCDRSINREQRVRENIEGKKLVPKWVGVEHMRRLIAPC